MILIGFVLFILGFALGIGLSHRKQPLELNLEWCSLFWAFSDIPGEKFFSELNLREFRKRKNVKSTFLYSLLQGMLHQKSKEGQKAYRIHRSLLHHSDASKSAKEILPIQLILDLYAQDQWEEADKAFKKLPRKWRKRAPLRGFLGLMQQHRGHPKDASVTFRSLCQDYPQAPFLREKFHQVLIELGRCYFRDQRFAKAQRICHEILTTSPSNPEALLLRTDLALASKDWPRAEMTLCQLASEPSLQKGRKWHNASAIYSLIIRIQELMKEKKDVHADLQALLSNDSNAFGVRLVHETHA